MFPLCDFLAANFASRELAPDCWLRRMIDDPDDETWDDVIQILQRHGADRDFARRLLQEHPDRPHVPQHDARLHDAFTEAEAFCWATEVAGFPTPKFVFEEGYPDLRAGRTWIEAKTIRHSAEWEAELDRLLKDDPGIVLIGPQNMRRPSSGLARKFHQQLTDANAKLRRPAGDLIVFFDWLGIDGGVRWRAAWADVMSWVDGASRDHSSRIVIAFNYNWREPSFDSA